MYVSREFKKIEFYAPTEALVADKLRLQFGLEWETFGAGWRGYYGSMAVVVWDQDRKAYRTTVYVNPDAEMAH